MKELLSKGEGKAEWGLITDYQDLEIWSWKLGGFYLENGLDFTWLAAATLKVAKAFGYMT
jgi:hypothetical protein